MRSRCCPQSARALLLVLTFRLVRSSDTCARRLLQAATLARRTGTNPRQHHATERHRRTTVRLRAHNSRAMFAVPSSSLALTADLNHPCSGEEINCSDARQRREAVQAHTQQAKAIAERHAAERDATLTSALSGPGSTRAPPPPPGAYCEAPSPPSSPSPAPRSATRARDSKRRAPGRSKERAHAHAACSRIARVVVM